MGGGAWWEEVPDGEEVPGGKRCLVGGGAWWEEVPDGEEVPGGRRCLMGRVAWWEEVPGGRRCLMGGGAWWEEVPNGKSCLVGRRRGLMGRRKYKNSLFDHTQTSALIGRLLFLVGQDQTGLVVMG